MCTPSIITITCLDRTHSLVTQFASKFIKRESSTLIVSHTQRTVHVHNNNNNKTECDNN